MRPLRVVAIGGGTGLSTLLRGLRRARVSARALSTPHRTDRRPRRRGHRHRRRRLLRPPAQGLQHAAPRRPAQLHGRAQRGRRPAGQALHPSLPRRRQAARATTSATSSSPRSPKSPATSPGHPAGLEDPGHPRQHLSRHHRQRHAGRPHGRRLAGARRNQHHRQQAPHRGTDAGPARCPRRCRRPWTPSTGPT